jgi:hypothetical protein
MPFFPSNPFMRALQSSRPVIQTVGIQPMKSSVGKPEYKARNILPWSKDRAAIHATRDILTAPVWGSTKPNEFITISGVVPSAAPVVIAVPTIAGSNIIQGGGK